MTGRRDRATRRCRRAESSARESLDRIAALRVHDAALARPRLRPGDQLRRRIALFEDAVSKIGPVEAADETLRFAQLEKTLDVVANALRRRRGEREHRDVRMQGAKRRDAPILRPKIVAPFADAMGFVDGDAAQVPALQTGEKAGKNEALGRDVEQPVLAAIERFEPLRGDRRRRSSCSGTSRGCRWPRARRPDPSSTRSAATRPASDPSSSIAGSW